MNSILISILLVLSVSCFSQTKYYNKIVDSKGIRYSVESNRVSIRAIDKKNNIIWEKNIFDDDFMRSVLLPETDISKLKITGINLGFDYMDSTEVIECRFARCTVLLNKKTGKPQSCACGGD